MVYSFTAINLIAPLFALVMIVKAVSHFRRNEKTWREVLVVSTVWGIFGYIGAVPGSVDALSGFLGVKSGINVLIFSALVILFYIVFQLIMSYEQLEMRLTRVVRELALKEREIEDGKK